MSVQFANDRTAETVATAQRACEHGAWERSVTLLAEADGLEAWAGVKCGAGSRSAIAATITTVRARQHAAERASAAEELAAEFGTDVSEWTV